MIAYSKAADFRQALLDRIRARRLPDPENLHKRIAMEWLLVRLQASEEKGWIL
jgi:hypothetical protein